MRKYVTFIIITLYYINDYLPYFNALCSAYKFYFTSKFINVLPLLIIP